VELGVGTEVNSEFGITLLISLRRKVMFERW
jgi:hypothetical protein